MSLRLSFFGGATTIAVSYNDATQVLHEVISQGTLVEFHIYSFTDQRTPVQIADNKIYIDEGSTAIGTLAMVNKK